MSSITIYKNIGELFTLAGAAAKDGRHIQEVDLGRISKAALVVAKGKIIWLGPQKNINKKLRKQLQTLVPGTGNDLGEFDLKGATVLPGFIECHTHSVFAGTRSTEFELRQNGISYQDIAKKGGGILSTVRDTRNATLANLERDLQKRVQQFISQGVTALEIKTGYGLDLKTELKCLEAIKKIKKISIVPTYLGAHAIPPEFASAKEYLKFSLKKVLPLIKKRNLAKRVDIFVEEGFFEKGEAATYLKAAQGLGFSLGIHADQLTLSGGAELACDLGAQSADHLIQVSAVQIARLAKSNVTAVLLPLADLYLKCAYPPARKMMDAGVRVALATDYNPGSSPSQDLSLVGLLSRLEMKMSLPEVIAGYTFNAARALDLHKSQGFLGPGMSANFISIEGDWTELFYSAGSSKVKKVYHFGKQIY